MAPITITLSTLHNQILITCVWISPPTNAPSSESNISFLSSDTLHSFLGYVHAMRMGGDDVQKLHVRCDGGTWGEYVTGKGGKRHGKSESKNKESR
jgi:hypothetical protein